MNDDFETPKPITPFKRVERALGFGSDDEDPRARGWPGAEEQPSGGTGRALEGAERQRGYANGQRGGELEGPEDQGFGELGGQSPERWSTTSNRNDRPAAARAYT